MWGRDTKYSATEAININMRCIEMDERRRIRHQEKRLTLT